MGYYPTYELEDDEPRKEPTYNEAFKDGFEHCKKKVLNLIHELITDNRGRDLNGQWLKEYIEKLK